MEAVINKKLDKNVILYYSKYLNNWISKRVNRKKKLIDILEKSRRFLNETKNINENDKIAYNL